MKILIVKTFPERAQIGMQYGYRFAWKIEHKGRNYGEIGFSKVPLPLEEVEKIAQREAEKIIQKYDILPTNR